MQTIFRRCKYKVQKVEKSALGTVYVCTHGAPKHSTKGCRRTYLSQRDLHSHHTHRHLPKSTSNSKQQSVPPSITVTSSVQPAPNQLPMTQQQAQQQASQQRQQIGATQSPVAARGLLSPSQGQSLSMPSQMAGMLMSSNSAQSSPLIPGLGGLNAGVTSQASPHMQPSISPKPPLQQPQQNLNLYSGQPIQNNPTDIYRPVDLGNNLPNTLQQQQPQPPHRHMHQPQLQQQPQGLLTSSGAHIQQGMSGNQPSFGQPAHFQHTPPPNQVPQQSQQMGVSSVQQTMMSPGIHMGQHQQPQQHHHHQQSQRHNLSVSQHLETFSPQNPPPNAASSPMTMTMANASQSRTNNLITVPIQDEGQYRPLPYVNTSLGNQPSTQSWPNSGTYAHGMTAGFPAKHGGGSEVAHAPNLMGAGVDQTQGMIFNQGQGNNQNPNFNPADAHRPAMGMNFSQPGGQAVPSRLGFNQSGIQQSNAPGMPPFSQGMPMNPIPVPGMGGVGGGTNITHGLVRAISMVAAASRSHPVSGGPGMRQVGPGLNTQSGGRGNRFQGPPSGRWPSHRGMQPRMGGNQTQSRSHDNNFNQGPYFK